MPTAPVRLGGTRLRYRRKSPTLSTILRAKQGLGVQQIPKVQIFATDIDERDHYGSGLEDIRNSW